jgi:hypothetical protein
MLVTCMHDIHWVVYWIQLFQSSSYNLALLKSNRIVQRRKRSQETQYNINNSLGLANLWKQYSRCSASLIYQEKG